MDEKGRSLAQSVWTRMDRKAGAITELTIRQLRHRVSTWVVLSVGALVMALLLAFYIDGIRDEFDPIDNDGDSEDWDNDGYPRGQEDKYGTSDWDGEEYPGSGYYVYSGEVDWNDASRTHSGNHTWDGVGHLDAEWINVDYSGNRWSGVVDWDDVDACQDGEAMEDWWIEWGSACVYEDGTYFVNGKFKASGAVNVPENYYMEWGYFTLETYVDPDSPSMYIDEDGILWDGEDASELYDESNCHVDIQYSQTVYVCDGFEVDDDGDCLNNPNDDNNNGIPCDVIWILDSDKDEIVDIRADYNVNEDPAETDFEGEMVHRAFIIGTGKMAFVMMLGIFIPLFLALGLIRDETENGTLHYLLSKPIHRAEFILYRLLGYLLLAGTYILVLVLIMAFVTSLIAPGDSIVRLSDYPVWLGIGLATILVLAAYGAVYNTIGLIAPKYGVYFCIILGIWEFIMGLFTMTLPSSNVPMLSVSHWALQLIDAVVLLTWPDTLQYTQIANAFGVDSGLPFFWQPPVHTLGTQNPAVALLVSCTVLILITLMMMAIGQSSFKNREIM